MTPDCSARILLVEDNPDDVLFLKRAFKKAGVPTFFRVLGDGHEVTEYLAGRGAYADRVSHPAPSHLILDLKLPKMTGLEVLAWLRGKGGFRDLPVAVLSSSGELSDRERALALRIDGYFLKQSGQADLVDTVRDLARLWGLPSRMP